MGAIVSDSKNEMAMAMATVRPKATKKRPMMPSAKATGRKTAMTVAVVASTGRKTSAVPTLAASRGGVPMCTQRRMFSRTTMASSMTRPTTRARASSEMLLSPIPIRFIKKSVEIMITGRPAMVTIVLRRSPKEGKDDERRQQGAPQQIFDGAVDRAAHLDRLVAGDGELEVGVGGEDGFERLLDVVDDGDGVGTALLAHADHHRLDAVEARDDLALLVAVLDRGNVAEVDGRAAVLDDDLANIVERGEVAGRAQRQLLPAGNQRAARYVEIFRLQRGDHLLRGDVACLHGRGVEQDADLALLAAGHVGGGDIGDALQRRLDRVLHQRPQLDGRELARRIGHAHLHDRRVGRVVAADKRLLDAAGQAVAQQPDLLTHLFDRLVGRNVELELEDDVAHPLGRVGLHGVDAADGRQLVLQLARHLVLDLGGAGARVDGGDHRHRKFDVGENVDGHPEIGKDTHHDAGGQHHGHKDRLANGNIPKFHRLLSAVAKPDSAAY